VVHGARLVDVRKTYIVWKIEKKEILYNISYLGTTLTQYIYIASNVTISP
jgi:hypothetical protein